MKIGRFLQHGSSQIGTIHHDMVHLVNPMPGLDVLTILNLPEQQRIDIELAAGRNFRAPIDEVEWLPPVEPRAMRDFVAFEAHIAGMKKGEPGDGSVPESWYEAPVFLFMNPWSVIGTGAEIAYPPFTERLDFELEVAMVVKDTVKDVSLDDASSHIAGYTILNDWSARDIQGREMRAGLGPSKGKDFANTLGPWITTPDELEQFRDGDRLALEMSVAVNGQIIGTDNLKNLSWSFEELLVHASRDAYVGAGDILGTGTASQGALAERWARSGGDITTFPPLKVGDEVTLTVQGLGSVTNRITPTTSPGFTVPRARRMYGPDRL